MSLVNTVGLSFCFFLCKVVASGSELSISTWFLGNIISHQMRTIPFVVAGVMVLNIPLNAEKVLLDELWSGNKAIHVLLFEMFRMDLNKNVDLNYLTLLGLSWSMDKNA